MDVGTEGSAFVIFRNVDYGVTLRDAFVEAFPTMGGEILGAEAVPADASDVRAQLSKVKRAAPDFIFAAVHYKEGGALLRQARELGIDSLIIGTDGGHDPQLLEIAGNAAEGSYWVTIGWDDSPNNSHVTRFQNSFRKRYQRDPGVYSGLYYDATHVLAKALANAQSISGPEIRKALHLVEHDGPTGHTRFDQYGDVTKPFSVYEIRNGEFLPFARPARQVAVAAGAQE